MVIVAMETEYERYGNNKISIKGFIPFCYIFVVQIPPIQTFDIYNIASKISQQKSLYSVCYLTQGHFQLLW